MFNKDDILKYFSIPLKLEHKKTRQDITGDLINDLELDISHNPYSILFSPTSIRDEDIERANLERPVTGTTPEKTLALSQLTIPLWRESYSTNPKFIKKIQKFIKGYKYNNTLSNSNFINEWLEFKNENGFLKKYEYFDWKHLEFLNKNDTMLQITNYLNISSPVISLLIPLILFIIPLIIIMLNKQPCNLPNYICLLKKQLQNHAFGKIFSLFSREITTAQKATSALAIGFFAFTTYQNILMCIKIKSNMEFIQSFLYKTKAQISHTMDILRHILNVSGNTGLKKYNIYIQEKYTDIEKLYNEFSIIKTDNFSVKTIFNIGKYMKLFYKLYNDDECYKLMMFGFGINGFSDNIEMLQKHINREKLNKCTFNKNKTHELKDSYYIHFIDNEFNVKNDILLDTNYIIHGPNASGKTTVLKSTLLNILFSQQFGFGCYSSCNIPCYKKLYSYINIPDSKDRDSLFQAEARRCLDIVNDINAINGENNENTYDYLAIYDELYSGTNPNEAISSAKGYIKYLENNNIRYMLTSHFDELKYMNSKSVSETDTQIEREMTSKENKENKENTESKESNKSTSYYMDCNRDNDTKEIKYKYTIERGHSNITGGGLQVLEKLNYPIEIIDYVKSFV